MYKKIFLLWILIATSFGCLVCGNVVEPESETETAADELEEIVIVENGKDHDDSDDYSWNSSEEIPISFNADIITVEGTGATVDGSIVTITSAGTYNLTGSLDDGQIIVNTEDKDITRLLLNGVNLNCSKSAPIYIENAKTAMIVLIENTENFITDGPSYIYADANTNEPNAPIFSKSDLTIYGTGSLTVNGNYNDGIASKDGLIISSGTITVNSVDDGIRGKDYLIIKDGNITVDAIGIGLKSDNVDDPSLGYITIENGAININAVGAAIEAEKDVLVSSGDIVLSSEEKGINGAMSTSIDGGNLTITSVDDAIHSNGYVTINDGSLLLSSSDDGIHANVDLVINDGIINILNSYEGIESAMGNITINGGEIHLVSSDDGLNLAAGGDSGHGSTSTGNYYLYIHGGYIVVNAGGDGVDANASVEMTDGTLIVSGSSASNNSALDYDGSFAMNGGFLVAAGSSRMAEAPGTLSTQNCILVNLNSTQSAETLIHIETQAGQEILTFSPSKSYQSVALSSPDLVKNSSYNVYTGGSYSGTLTDGLYTNGTYSSGSLAKSFTISSTVTIIN